MSLGAYSGFILGAYAMAFLTVAALIVWVALDYGRQKRVLRDFEARGVGRRSDSRVRETAAS